MNLRLDPKSIRVRICYKEALILQQNRTISEHFYLPNKPLILNLTLVNDNEMSISENSLGNIEVLIPKIKLEEMLLNSESGNLSKKDSELRGVFKQNNNTIDLLFEIDRFTIGQLK